MTGSDGVLRWASGCHFETIFVSKVCIVLTLLVRESILIVKEKLMNIVISRNTVDILLTDHGTSVNPNRKNIKDNLHNKNFNSFNL